MSLSSVLDWLRRMGSSPRAWLLAVLVLLLGVVMGAQVWGRWLLVHELGQALHRPVRVQSLVLRPWALSVEVNGLSVANGRGGELAGWERLQVQVSPESWRQRGVVLDDVQMHGLRVMVTQQDGRYDIDDLLHPETPQVESAPPRYALHRLAVHNARLALHDAATQHTAVLAQGDVSGHVNALTDVPQAEVDMTLKAPNLAEAQTALRLALPAQVSQGQADAKLHLTWAQPPKAKMALQAKGQVQVSEVALQDTSGHITLAFKNLGVQLDLLDVVRRQVQIRELTVDQPQLRIQLVSAGAAMGSSEGKASGVASADAAPTETDWQVAVDQLSLQNGVLNFRDERVQPAFHARVANLNGTLQGLNTSANTQADLALTGTYSGNAPVTLQARLNPLAVNKFLELRAKVKNLELPRFSSYMGKYAGYTLEKGKGTLDVAYHLHDGQLTAENHVFIDQLTLGERVDSPNATQLPVSLAIALLKNRQGQIELDLPVSGSLDDPQFSIAKVVGAAVWNLVAKVVTSPFEFLQSVFSGAGALSEAGFAPGSAVLDVQATQTLTQLAKAMQERPALTLEVRGVFDAQRDATALPTTAKDDAAKQEALTSLAQRRATAVQRWLTDNGKVTPERVFVLAPKARVSEASATAGAVFTLR